MSKTLKLGLVGLGKIARDQHLPSIAATEGVELVAIASRNAREEGVANFPDLDSMLARAPNLDAIILCQPPQPRYDAARIALNAGKHVFLEKPPGATVSEVESLIDLASINNVTLFASWHSRYAAGVSRAKQWLATRAIKSIAISWKEDVRHWHPGQDWIWTPGGFGVFDPGINALSILTEIVGDKIRLREAELEFPLNRDAPIAAKLQMETSAGAPVSAEFDWRQTGPQTWDIRVDTDAGALLLGAGGNTLAIDGTNLSLAREEEYPAMCRRFVDLVRTGGQDVDLAPLKLVSDAFLRGRICRTDRFDD